MFGEFKKSLQAHIALLIKESGNRLYVVDVDKDLLWETYLGAFPVDVRQEYTCNACKSFIRQFGNVVGINGLETQSIWDFNCKDYPFQQVLDAMDNLVGDKPIRDVFYSAFPTVGLDKNRERKEDGTVLTWEHMFYTLPREVYISGGGSVESFMGEARDTRNVFLRSLKELTQEAVDTVLELIAQGSLYRGEEFKGMLTDFRIVQNRFFMIPEKAQENFCWSEAGKYGQSIARIRNTAIGTLLTNLSEKMDLDRAVTAWEAVMAPTNYKRPAAIITSKMVEQAEKTIEELGYAQSLGRRFATVDDISVNEVLFVDRSLTKPTGVLAELKEAVSVNPQAFAKLEEIPITKFMTEVLPKASKIEVLVENRHIPNLVSVIAPKDSKAPSPFKWDNAFSWCYKDAVADSMKEKVKKAGGKVEGELRISLEWYNMDDLDLHVVEPGPRGGNGHHIYYADKHSVTGGNLDVDMNAGVGTTREPVENVIYPTSAKMPEGKYRVYVHQFSKRETIDVGFSLEIECQGQILTFGYHKPVVGNVELVIEYSKKGGVKVTQMDKDLKTELKINSKTVWGVETCKFHPASMVMFSPNHWGDHNTGNEHVIFVIDKAHNDEQARGFFNEFLKPDLEKHKRVFEALGSRMKVDPADKQVSGLGFSSTQRGDLIVNVSGAFSRTVKVKF